MEHRPHLSINDIGSSILGENDESWYIHFDCTKSPTDKTKRWNIITLDCYSPGEILECEACNRRFGKQALKWLRSRPATIFEFSSLEHMQRFAKENKSKAYRAHAAFQPPKTLTP